MRFFPFNPLQEFHGLRDAFGRQLPNIPAKVLILGTRGRCVNHELVDLLALRPGEKPSTLREAEVGSPQVIRTGIRIPRGQKIIYVANRDQGFVEACISDRVQCPRPVILRGITSHVVIFPKFEPAQEVRENTVQALRKILEECSCPIVYVCFVHDANG